MDLLYRFYQQASPENNPQKKSENKKSFFIGGTYRGYPKGFWMFYSIQIPTYPQYKSENKKSKNNSGFKGLHPNHFYAKIKVKYLRRNYMKEEWKLVKGYEQVLAVSNFGNACRPGILLPDGTKRDVLMRSVATHHTGYKYIIIKVKGVQKFLLMHRLVAEAFIPNPDNLPEVNHKDFNKENNFTTNLEWVTHRQNMEHANSVERKAIKKKTRKYSKHGGIKKKPILAISPEKKEEVYESVNACARGINGFSTNICKCLKGTMKTYKGYTFEYIEKE